MQFKNITPKNKYIINNNPPKLIIEFFNEQEFLKDIDKSIEIFKDKLGYNPIFFSYPFGEYSLEQINYIKKNLNMDSDNTQV